MKRRKFLSASITAGALAMPLVSSSAPKRKVLLVSHSAGFMHGVIKRSADGSLSLAEKVLKEIGDRSGAFEVSRFVYSKEECAQITPELLRSFDCYFFYTTGNVPLPEETKKALLESVKSGKGFCGSHCATDTYYNIPEYGEMIGGYFNGHPWHQKVRVVVEDKTHPITKPLGDAYEITDEIYQYRDPYSREKLRVLGSLDNNFAGFDPNKGKREDKDYAIIWVKTYAKGRVFYTALGHRDEVWNDERFQTLLLHGIKWACGDLAGSATPVLKK